MTRDETKLIIKVLTTTYPNYKPRDLSETVDIWSSMLTDYDYQTIAQALQKYILSDTSGFAPSIGQVIGMISTSKMAEPLEAWALVRKALRNSYYESVEEFNKLPPECQAAIGSPENLKEMSVMDLETVETVEQSHFIRSYQNVVKRLEEERRIPPALRDYTKQLAQKPTPQIEVKEQPQDVTVEVTDRVPLEELFKQKLKARREVSNE